MIWMRSAIVDQICLAATASASSESPPGHTLGHIWELLPSSREVQPEFPFLRGLYLREIPSISCGFHAFHCAKKKIHFRLFSLPKPLMVQGVKSE